MRNCRIKEKKSLNLTGIISTSAYDSTDYNERKLILLSVKSHDMCVSVCVRHVHVRQAREEEKGMRPERGPATVYANLT